MTTTLTVEGMACDHCEQTVEDALEAIPSVKTATADRESETVTVEGNADKNDLVIAVTDAGYNATA